MKVKCDFCSKELEKSDYEIKKTKHNFCSLKCKGLFEKTVVEVVCINCEKIFFKKNSQIKKTNNNFCSRSCAAIYNNKKYPKKGDGYKINCCKIQYEEHPCINCGRMISIRKKYCNMNCRHEYAIKKNTSSCLECGKKLYNASRGRRIQKFCNNKNKCSNEYKYKEYIKKWLVGEVNGLQESGEVVSKRVRRWLYETRGEKCEECNWNTAHPVTGNIQLDIHHIDGDVWNNRPENLKVYCVRCHAMTPNYRALNKGCGRKLRYKKEIMPK